MTRLLALLPLALLAACGSSDGKEGESPAPSAAEPADKADLLLNSLLNPRQPGVYAPRDECSPVSGAKEFRLALAKAVVARDADALVKLTTPDVLLDFGGGAGTDELRKRLVDPNYELWQALENLVSLGCAVNEQGGFTLPWYFAQSFGDRDTYMLLLVRGQDVPMLAEPKVGAKQIAPLSWAVVELDESTDDRGDFAKVKTDEGVEGYVAWDSLRSLIDYRLVVEEREDGWKIAAFVAGD